MAANSRDVEVVRDRCFLMDFESIPHSIRKLYPF